MARSIGQGVQFLNRHLSAAMFGGSAVASASGTERMPSEGKAQLLEFLRTLRLRVRVSVRVHVRRRVCCLWSLSCSTGSTFRC